MFNDESCPLACMVEVLALREFRPRSNGRNHQTQSKGCATAPKKSGLVRQMQANSTALQIGNSVFRMSAESNCRTTLALLGILALCSLVWVVYLTAPRPKVQAQRIHSVNQITMTMTSSNAPQIAPLKLE